MVSDREEVFIEGDVQKVSQKSRRAAEALQWAAMSSGAEVSPAPTRAPKTSQQSPRSGCGAPGPLGHEILGLTKEKGVCASSEGNFTPPRGH